jgi:hypothetical protein
MNAPGGDTANADICPTRDPVKPQFALERAIRPKNRRRPRTVCGRPQPAKGDDRVAHA